MALLALQNRANIYKLPLRFQNMKGLLQRVVELSDCGRCLDDMAFGPSEQFKPVDGKVPDVRALRRLF